MLVVFEVNESWEWMVGSFPGDEFVVWAVALARKIVTALALACWVRELVDFQSGPLRLPRAIDGDRLRTPLLRTEETLERL